jgi:uncharacterized membrane protein YcfT
MGAQGLRVDWVDIAKGICIVFVVMMHSTLGVAEHAGDTGYMGAIVEFARPFRMPDFFLISGLFLGLVIDRPWRRYFDRKVVHFLYFYVLWLTIQFAFKAPGMALENGAAYAVSRYLLAFVEPFGTLWFIYILPVFFLFTRFVRTLPAWLVFAWSAVMEMLPVHTGWLIFDEFASRYVYFFAGYAFAGQAFAMAEWCRRNIAWALGLLAVWAAVNAALVFTPAPAAIAALPFAERIADHGLAGLPGLSLLLGFAGAGAIVTAASLLGLVPRASWPVSWLGARSIVVYLAFFLPMAVARTVLLETGLIASGAGMAFLVTAAGVIGPVALYMIVEKTGYGRFLFERPQWAIWEKRRRDRKAAGAPAE